MITQKLQELKRKYPNGIWCDTKKEALQYLNDCYEMYEDAGFMEDFYSPYVQYEMYNGHKFSVIRRLTELDGFDLEALPGWLIKLDDGTEVTAFPEEITKIERI